MAILMGGEFVISFRPSTNLVDCSQNTDHQNTHLKGGGGSLLCQSNFRNRNLKLTVLSTATGLSDVSPDPSDDDIAERLYLQKGVYNSVFEFLKARIEQNEDEKETIRWVKDEEKQAGAAAFKRFYITFVTA